MDHRELDPGFSCRICQNWIEIETDLDDHLPTGVTAWSLARANAWLNGPGRLVVSPDGRIRVRGEFPSQPVSDLGRARGSDDPVDETGVRAACLVLRSIRDAVDRVLDKGVRDSSDEPALDAGRSRRSADLCTEAGWPCSPRDDGGASLTIGSRPARVAPAASGAPLVQMPLADVTAFSDISREAVGLLLLRVGACVRGVKGAVMRIDGIDMALMVSATDGLDSTSAVEQALGALTVGSRQILDGVLALEQVSLARQYVARRRWQQRDAVASSAAPEQQQRTEDPCLQVP